MESTETQPLSELELELSEHTGGIHINRLLLNRIKQWANQPENSTTIKKAVEDTLWEKFGGKPSELVAREEKTTSSRS